MDNQVIFIIIGMICIIILILFSIFDYKRRNRNNYNDKIGVKLINFKSDHTLTMEKDFINYLHEYVVEDKIAEKNVHEIRKYFDLNFESILLGYVFTTENKLIIFDKQAFVKKVVKFYEDINID